MYKEAQEVIRIVGGISMFCAKFPKLLQLVDDLTEKIVYLRVKDKFVGENKQNERLIDDQKDSYAACLKTAPALHLSCLQ